MDIQWSGHMLIAKAQERSPIRVLLKLSRYSTLCPLSMYDRQRDGGGGGGCPMNE